MTVELTGVSIRYGSRTAVDDVTVGFPAGAVGLLGRNGAGKSSILKALLGLVPLQAGSMRILDLPGDAPPDVIRARVGYMPERDCHIAGLNGYETVALLARLSGLPERESARRAHEVLYLVGLEEQRYRLVSGYSTGMRQKVKLAGALVHDPAVIFLDEPTSGLDPDGREEMLALVRQLSTEMQKSVVLSTHILQDVEAVCSHAVLLEQGRLLAHGTLSELTAGQPRVYHLQVEPAELCLAAPPGSGIELEPEGSGRLRAVMPEGCTAAALFACVQAAGGSVRQLALHRRTLEEVFLGAVGSGPVEGR